MSKLSKDEVNYSRGMQNSHCGKLFKDDNGYCEHFVDIRSGNGTCKLVEGVIERLYWCNKFSKAK